MRRATLILAAALALTAGALAAGGAAPAKQAAVRTFTENFAWSGNHAATINDGRGSTVWWPESSWDTRGDTHSIDLYGPIQINCHPPPGANDCTDGKRWTTGCADFVQPLPDGSCPPGQALPEVQTTGFHVDIHKALSTTLKDGRESNTVLKPDGTAGVGIMRTDTQGIITARLRNPMLISASRPGVVSFYAPLFTTSGAWWEVAIVSTDQPTGGEYTMVPARSNSGGRPPSETAPGPQRSDGGDNGPGHRDDTVPSMNLISFGWPDIPTELDGSGHPFGWRTRFVLSKYVNPDLSTLDHRVIEHRFNPTPGTKLPLSKPADLWELYPWKLVYTPTRVRLYADLNEDGKLELRGDYKIAVPWKEVYVELLMASYQADHHPQWCCGYNESNGVTHIREIAWKHVAVSPVKYSRTYVLPGGDTAALRTAGWMSYDLRDIQRYGPPVDGAPQPNAGPYDYYSSELYCSQVNPGGVDCPSAPNCAGDTGECGPVNLSFSLTAAQRSRIARIQLLSDVKHVGLVTVYLNGKRQGSLPRVLERPAPSYCGDSGHEACDSQFEPDAWVRRGIDLSTADLHDGSNTLRLVLETGQQVELDRLQVEVDER